MIFGSGLVVSTNINGILEDSFYIEHKIVGERDDQSIASYSRDPFKNSLNNSYAEKVEKIFFYVLSYKKRTESL